MASSGWMNLSSGSDLKIFVCSKKCCTWLCRVQGNVCMAMEDQRANQGSIITVIEVTALEYLIRGNN